MNWHGDAFRRDHVCEVGGCVFWLREEREEEERRVEIDVSRWPCHLAKSALAAECSGRTASILIIDSEILAVCGR